MLQYDYNYMLIKGAKNIVFRFAQPSKFELNFFKINLPIFDFYNIYKY